MRVDVEHLPESRIHGQQSIVVERCEPIQKARSRHIDRSCRDAIQAESLNAPARLSRLAGIHE